MTWEHVLTADYHGSTAFSSFTATRSSTYARTGTYSYKLTNTSMVLPVSSSATKYVSFASLVDHVTGEAAYVYFREGTTIHVAFVLETSSGLVKVYRGTPTANLLGSGTFGGQAEWVPLDCYINVHDSTGSVVIKDGNGNTVVNITGADTKNGGTGAIDNVYWGTSLAINMYIDDIAVRTDDYCGTHGNYALTAGSDGSDTGWTASSGDRYACVDEVPPDFTDYISTDVSVTGTKNTVNVSNLSITPTEIQLVAVYALAKLDAAGAGSIRCIVNSNGTYGNGSSESLDVSAEYVAGFFDTDPDTASAWTESGVNAAQAGVETI